jgi:uncharacterized membrane protein (DUF485 family)
VGVYSHVMQHAQTITMFILFTLLAAFKTKLCAHLLTNSTRIGVHVLGIL